MKRKAVPVVSGHCRKPAGQTRTATRWTVSILPAWRCGVKRASQRGPAAPRARKKTKEGTGRRRAAILVAPCSCTHTQWYGGAAPDMASKTTTPFLMQTSGLVDRFRLTRPTTLVLLKKNRIESNVWWKF
uniref:Uncharacterized protein n=1 Tax=Setaria italica TaxID=4555 RepID=K4AGL6_SETIT